jgi:DNA-binding XRE family transcriptional regulator
MRLGDYLNAAKLTPDEFAALAQVHRATIYRVLNEPGYAPSLKTALAIEKASHRKVRPADLA